jgi:beta-lactamase class A
MTRASSSRRLVRSYPIRVTIVAVGLIGLLIAVLAMPAPVHSRTMTTDASADWMAMGQGCTPLTPPARQVGTDVPQTTSALAEAFGETEIRYGPGIDYPRVGAIRKGHLYPVLRRHIRFPWLEIAFPGVAGGRGWVYQGAVRITGDLSRVPTTDERRFDYPTLTPTPLMVVTSVPSGAATPLAGTDGILTQLGQDIYHYLLTQRFEPGTDRQGSIFIMDLTSGRSVSVNPGVVYSAASLMKLPVLVALYRKLDRLPSADEARLIARMMVCSDNAAADTILGSLGEGSESRGAALVNETLARLGLRHTVLAELFSQRPTPIAQDTTLDESSQTDADPDNYSTPAELGLLLTGLYRCAVDGSGPMITALERKVSIAECRQIINTMRAVRFGVMIEGGVPQGVPVAHKPGMIPDTHGDAALVTTAGGTYILVVMLHAKAYLSSDQSFAAIAEISRLAYNAFNPTHKLNQIHLKLNRECFPSAALLHTLQSASPPDIP